MFPRYNQAVLPEVIDDKPINPEPEDLSEEQGIDLIAKLEKESMKAQKELIKEEKKRRLRKKEKRKIIEGKRLQKKKKERGQGCRNNTENDTW